MAAGPQNGRFDICGVSAHAMDELGLKEWECRTILKEKRK
jgi:hypothetical protein